MLHGIYMQQPEGQSPEAVKYYGTLGLEVLIAYTLYGKTEWTHCPVVDNTPLTMISWEINIWWKQQIFNPSM